MQMIIGSVCLLIGSAFCGQVAAVLWLRLRTGVRALDTALFLALWVFVVTLLMMFVCALGILDVRTLTTVSLAGSLAAGLLFRREGRDFWIACRGCLSAVAGFGRQWPGLSLLYCSLAIVLALRALAHTWFLPPYVWDTLVYHLPRLPEWIQHRGLFVIDTSIDRLYWPANFELFQCWFVIFLRHDVIVEVAGLFPYALAVLSVYSICRSFGARAPWAAGAAALFSTTPAIVLGAVSCKNDIAIAAWFLFMVAAIAEMAKTRGPLRAHARYVAILALAFGAALGTKPYIVFIAPGLVVLYILLRFDREIRAQRRTGSALGTAWITFVLVLSLLVGLFWYARNAAVFGNPFHPSYFRLHGRVIAGAATGQEYAQSEFKWSSAKESYKQLQQRIFDRQGALTPENAGMAGWGAFAVTCGLPAAVLMLLRRSPARALLLSFVISLTCLLGSVAPDPWNLRFTMWFPGALAVAFVLLLQSFRSESVGRALLGLAGVCAVLNTAATLNNGYLSTGAWRKQFRTPVLERSSARLLGGDHRHLLDVVPRGGTIWYDMYPNGWLYPLYGADYGWKTRCMRVLSAGDLPDLMRKEGARYLFISYRGKMIKAKVTPYIEAGRLLDRGKGLYELP